MEWMRVQVQTTPLGAEIVADVLLGRGVAGTEVVNAGERVRHLTETAASWDYAEDGLLEVNSDDVYVIFYVAKDENGAVLLEDVRQDIAKLQSAGMDLGELTMSTESANDETWLNEWKKHFKPLHIEKIVVVPEWETYAPVDGEIVFRIDPGSAFGTGQHQTTRLCILAMQAYLQGGEAVLDVGCGSGILSIVALLLGAENVLACDIDPAGAIAATKANAQLNGIASNRLQIRAGDALSDEVLRDEISAVSFDLIVANIVADVVIGLVPFVKNLLTQGGVFIASGIIDERGDDVRRAFAENEMKILQTFELDGWVCFAGAKI